MKCIIFISDYLECERRYSIKKYGIIVYTTPQMLLHNPNAYILYILYSLRVLKKYLI